MRLETNPPRPTLMAGQGEVVRIKSNRIEVEATVRSIDLAGSDDVTGGTTGGFGVR